MKRPFLSRLALLLVLLAGLSFIAWLVRPQPIRQDPYEVVDILADAGIDLSASPVEADLLAQRKIVIATDVNAALAQRVIRSLLLLDAADPAAPIDLYIRTEGGWISDAFAIVDIIQTIRAPVNTHAIGGAHSSGAMILAAGTGERVAYSYSSIMFHGGLYEDDGEFGENRIDNRRLTAFWRKHARLPAEWLDVKKDSSFFLGPEDARKYGIVDRVWSEGQESSGEEQ